LLKNAKETVNYQMRAGVFAISLSFFFIPMSTYKEFFWCLFVVFHLIHLNSSGYFDYYISSAIRTVLLTVALITTSNAVRLVVPFISFFPSPQTPSVPTYPLQAASSTNTA